MRIRGFVGVLAAVMCGPVALAHAGPGDLKPIEVHRDGTAGVDGIAGASGIAVAPDGRDVYATGAGDSAIAHFRRSASGRLAFANAISDGEAGADDLALASGLAIAPDGLHVYVAANGDDAVTAFARDPESGDLTLVETERDEVGAVTDLDGANSVAVSPDGSHVYVAAIADGAVTAFARDKQTGAIEQLAAYRGSLDSAFFDRLEGAFGVYVSPNGRGVYATAYTDNAVSALRRNRATGLLKDAGFLDNGVTSAPAFSTPTTVAFTPNGRFAYVTAIFDDALSANRINKRTARLSFAGYARDGRQGIDGLGGAAGVAIAPDGSTAHVAAAGDDAVSSFDVNERTGRVRQLDLDRDGPKAALDGAAAIALAPDGKHAYVAADEGAITVFRRRHLPVTERVKVPRRQYAPRIAIAVRCSRRCSIRASARGRAGGRKFRVARKRTAADGVATTLRLALPASTAGRKGSARVRVRVRDRFGAGEALTRRVRLLEG